jgi:quercetin dioxygenase-like cupin family protein
MDWQDKIWGRTRLITKNAACELHEIEARQGGYCSIHQHRTKFNGFHVQSGRLLIRTWDSAGDESVSVLGAGEYLAVQPGLKHQFEALTDCRALELYWAEYSPEDIERDTVGGCRNPTTA